MSYRFYFEVEWKMNVSVVPDFEIPVFAPKLEEFSDFKSYVEKLERFYSSFGIVQVSEATTFEPVKIRET